MTAILHPNNLNKGSIVRLEVQKNRGSSSSTTLIDTLYRPVRYLIKDFTGDGQNFYPI